MQGGLDQDLGRENELIVSPDKVIFVCGERTGNIFSHGVKVGKWNHREQVG